MPRITATLRARTPEQLAELAGWLHDAELDPTLVTFDPAGGQATVPLAQEGDPRVGLPAPAVVGRTRLGAEVLDVAFVRFLLRIRHATALEIGPPATPGEPGMLAGARFDAQEGVLHVLAELGGDVRVAVRRLDVELEVTDEVVFRVQRRRRGRRESDRRMPPAASDGPGDRDRASREAPDRPGPL